MFKYLTALPSLMKYSYHCVMVLILFEIVLSEVSLLQNNYYFLSNEKLLLPTGQLHQVLWKMFSPLMLSLKLLFFITLFGVT